MIDEPKIPGDRVILSRAASDGQAIDDGWKLVRQEPSTGNAIVEKGKTRRSVPREDFDRHNFPGSDAVVREIETLTDEVRDEARAAFAKNELARVKSLLLRDTAAADPAFAGIQTAEDLAGTLATRKEETAKRIEIFRKKFEDAKRSYDVAVRTGKSNDTLDGLLMTMENAEDQLHTEEYKRAALDRFDSRLAALGTL